MLRLKKRRIEFLILFFLQGILKEKLFSPTDFQCIGWGKLYTILHHTS